MISNDTDRIRGNLERKIIDIKEINDHYKIEVIFNNTRDLDILEELINYYLKNILKNKSFEQIKSIEYETQEILNYFCFNYDLEDDNLTIYYNAMFEEANTIVYDLLNKLFKKNNRNINLPIKIDSLITYSISDFIKNDDVYKIIYLIILKLSIIYIY